MHTFVAECHLWCELGEYIILVGVVALGALAAFTELGSKVSAKTTEQGARVESGITTD